MTHMWGWTEEGILNNEPENKEFVIISKKKKNTARSHLIK